MLLRCYEMISPKSSAETRTWVYLHMWVEGKHEQIFSRRSVQVTGQISMTSYQFYVTLKILYFLW